MTIKFTLEQDFDFDDSATETFVRKTMPDDTSWPEILTEFTDSLKGFGYYLDKDKLIAWAEEYEL